MKNCNSNSCHNCRNCNDSKVGRSCNTSSTSDSKSFEKDRGNITDNEYEVSSETNRTRKNSKKKRSR